MGKPLDSPASLRPISLTSCISKLFECIILSRLLFFLESNSIFSLRQAVSALDVLVSIKFCFFLSPFRMGLPNSSLYLRRVLPQSTSQRLSTLTSRSFLQTYFGWPPSLLCLLNSIFPFSQAGFCGFTKPQKSLLLSLSRCAARIRSWLCSFLYFHQ